MENICLVFNLDVEELKNIEGGKNLIEYFVFGVGYLVEWVIDYDDVLAVPRPYGMY